MIRILLIRIRHNARLTFEEPAAAAQEESVTREDQLLITSWAGHIVADMT